MKSFDWIAAGLATRSFQRLPQDWEHMMVDENLVNILAWCKRERDYLQMQREMLRSGTFRIFRLEGDTPVDESEKTIETLSNNLAELDLILADYAVRCETS